MTWGIGSLQKGLVLHLPLDEQSFNPATKRFTDKSAYSNHGTGNGTQLGSATPGFQADHMGQLVRAAPFNGSDDYIDCGTGINFTAGQSFTLSAWVKPAGNGSVIRKYPGGKPDYGISVASSKAYLLWREGVNTTVVQNLGDNIVDGEYHLIMGVRDKSLNKAFLYLDGVLLNAGGTTDNTGDLTSGGDTVIGADRAASGWIEASISDVRIYNRALSQQEMTLLYESYRVR